MQAEVALIPSQVWECRDAAAVSHWEHWRRLDLGCWRRGTSWDAVSKAALAACGPSLVPVLLVLLVRDSTFVTRYKSSPLSAACLSFGISLL